MTVVSDLDALASATFLVEATAEDYDVKGGVLAELGRVSSDDAVLATTTSSLSVAQLAQASGRPDRFVGLHVFNPVPKMALVELAYAPRPSSRSARARRALCDALGKTAVEVPDIAGFVVNRLLFPYLFSAVELMEQTGLAPEAIDTVHAPRRRPPDGPAGAARLRRPRRLEGDRRGDRVARAAAPSPSSSPPASSARRPAGGCTTSGLDGR